MEVPAPENNPVVVPVLHPEVLLEAPRRSRWYKLLHWEYLPLSAIVIVTLILHILCLNYPRSIVWDEVWYVSDARSIIRGAGDMRPEHPALAKLFIVAGTLMFNNYTNPEIDKGVVLTESIDDETTALKVNDASLLSGVEYIRIEEEQIKIESVDITINQVKTASDGRHHGTAYASHQAGQTVYIYTDNENAFGWRFFSVIFGTANIVLIYFICKKLRLSWKASVAATFLMALDDMTFVHSSLALLDVYEVTFLLAGFLLYLHSKYLSTGVAFALSACCKLAGVLGLVAVALHWLIFRRDKWQWAFGSLVFAAVGFVFFTILFDYFITGELIDPVTRIKDMLTLTVINKFNIENPLGIASRPWTWLYPYVEPYTNAIVYSYDPKYFPQGFLLYTSFISWTIQFLIVPVFIYLIFKAWRGSDTARFTLLWIFATYIFWMTDAFTNRVTFVFYFLPTTPAICIGLGMAFSDIMDRLKAKRFRLGRVTPGMKASYAGIIFYFALHAVIFFMFNPAIPTTVRIWVSYVFKFP